MISQKEKYKQRCRNFRSKLNKIKQWDDYVRKGEEVNVCPECHSLLEFSFIRAGNVCINPDCKRFGDRVTIHEIKMYFNVNLDLKDIDNYKGICNHPKKGKNAL